MLCQLGQFIPPLSEMNDYWFILLNSYIESTYYVKGHILGIEYKERRYAAKSRQSCPTLWDPIDDSPPGYPVPGILQARTLEWVAISFSSAGKWKVKVKLLSRVWLFTNPWTVAYQAPPSMGFPRQEYWSGFAIAFSCLRMSRYQIFILFHSPTIN